MESIQNIIAQNLIYLRRKNNLTQQDLASAIGYSDNAVSRWERKESTPSVEILEVIANYFGLNVVDILNPKFSELDTPFDKRKKITRIFTVIITVSIFWTLSPVLYMYMLSMNTLAGSEWLVFVAMIPVSCIALYFYNRLWGNKTFHLAIMSVLWWSFLVLIYLYMMEINDNNFWQIFFIGIPLQLAQVLWFLTRRQV